MIFRTTACVCFLALLPCPMAFGATTNRDPDNQAYTLELWKHVAGEKSLYKSWSKAEVAPNLDCGPPLDANCKIYVNNRAKARTDMPVGSIVVAEHHEHGEKLTGVTIWFRQKPGYHAKTNDWYWAHFTPEGLAAKTALDTDPLARRGFVTVMDDGRLWIFRAGSQAMCDHFGVGELAKHVIMPGAGPMGLTVKAPDKDTILEYITAKQGFVTLARDGRIWVFRRGDAMIEKLKQQGELAKHVIRPSIGPRGLTLKSVDSETILEYLAAKPGFEIRIDDGRIWIFRPDSKELADYDKQGELAKHVIRPSAGPSGITLKAPDKETILEYVAAFDGFHTVIEDGRILVFRMGTPELQEFRKQGEPAKIVIRPNAGPLGMTVKAPDAETMNAYLRVAVR